MRFLTFKAVLHNVSIIICILQNNVCFFYICSKCLFIYCPIQHAISIHPGQLALASLLLLCQRQATEMNGCASAQGDLNSFLIPSQGGKSIVVGAADRKIELLLHKADAPIKPCYSLIL